MLTFAVPYKKILDVVIPVVILDAVIAAVDPLIQRAVIDNEILKKNAGLVIWLAILALVDGALALTQRRIAASIGESLIYDMRSKVFRHIQRMPLAFFARTHTGALMRRLNNDVLFSIVVGNLVTVVIVGVSGPWMGESRRVR
jgi:ATP-binding cassette, subfamily B, bacterial